MSFALQDVGAIQSSGMNAHSHAIGRRWRGRFHFPEVDSIDSPEMLDYDRAHGGTIGRALLNRN